MGKHQSSSKAARKSKVDIDWDNRVLCSDGNCIGVIGPDGNCKECGKPYEGKLPWEIKSDQPAPDTDTRQPEDISDTEEQPVEDGEQNADDEQNAEEKDFDDSDWENRKLCSDGNCIGVIGPDGRCKECGKPYEGD
jgi:hypothetical protein